MSIYMKNHQTKAKISVLDRHIVKSDNIILTRNESVRRGEKIMIFCILDRGVMIVIKAVMVENGGESRVLE